MLAFGHNVNRHHATTAQWGVTPSMVESSAVVCSAATVFPEYHGWRLLKVQNHATEYCE
jgi:hypothetical protein